MTTELKPSTTLDGNPNYPFEFSICTLVTDHEEYAGMKSSFYEAGFTEGDCEFLIIDNSKANTMEAFSGLNLFLRKATGKYIIICHQDILLHDDNRMVLEERIRELDIKDPHWAVIGNAGGVNLKHRLQHITKGTTGQTIEEKHLPIKVITVDENFILVKNEANLALSADLKGFHMYGTDLCLIADVLGYHSYVVAFNLTHKSDGNADETFYQLKRNLIRKYRYAFRSRFVSTTVTRFYLSPKGWKSWICNSVPVLFLVRQYYKFFTVKKSYSIKYKDMQP
ncbi:glycosyltransferase family A protein [Negadavirga shengliensis]|uniref:Glycosyltransferase family A protein n=1 Tax=Negadavirga shengliensis TaxID=1389218 RepID=A0ABV9SX23_9BACT